MTQPLLRQSAHAVTMGDPAGIGLDICLKAWSMRNTEPVPEFFVIAPPDYLRQRAEATNLPLTLKILTNPLLAKQTFGEALPVIELKHPGPVTPGRPKSRLTPVIIESIERAVQFVHQGKAASIVTNPINKSVLYEHGFEYKGHTDYLATFAHLWGKKSSPVMMLACEELKVVPLTVHIPVKDIPKALSTSLITRTVQTVEHALKNLFGLDRPAIAITGLNPHAGENGTMGDEEIKIIIPAVKEMIDAGINISGPHPADTIFHKEARQNYDAVIAMYHDQALIPIKTIAFDRGVNITLDLPFVRTSPDHGTAYKIAGTDKPDPRSFLEALRLADRLAKSAATTAIMGNQ